MRTGSLLLVALAGLCPAQEPKPAPAREEWLQLFNGRDLEGWTPKIAGHELGDNYARTFRVEDGVLRVSYDGYTEFGGRFGHLFYKQAFSDYRLRVEYRFTGEQVRGGPGWGWRMARRPSWARRTAGTGFTGWATSTGRQRSICGATASRPSQAHSQGCACAWPTSRKPHPPGPRSRWLDSSRIIIAATSRCWRSGHFSTCCRSLCAAAPSSSSSTSRGS